MLKCVKSFLSYYCYECFANLSNIIWKPLKSYHFFFNFQFFLHHYKNVQIETRKCSKKKLKQIFRDNEHKEKEKRKKHYQRCKKNLLDKKEINNNAIKDIVLDWKNNQRQNNEQIFNAFLFNIRNHSHEVINIQQREVDFNIILLRVNNFDIKQKRHEMFVLSSATITKLDPGR